MLILDDLHRDNVLTWYDPVCNVKYTSDKRSLDTADLVTVQIYIRFPVDTIEIQEQTILLESFGYLKLIPIPEIRVEE